jgi:predicted lipoprotein with Yx(FWY)xxD motif
MRHLTLITGLTLSTLLAACAGGAVKPGAAPVGNAGGMLVNPAGMTLYVFDKDGAGKSACNGECAVKWPPLPADAGAAASGDFAPIQRDDGKHQWTYKGKPLYTWFKDQKPGDSSGDGVNNVWHVAKP